MKLQALTENTSRPHQRTMHGGFYESRLRRKSCGKDDDDDDDEDDDTGRLADLCCHFSGKRVHVMLAPNPFASKRHRCVANNTILTEQAACEPSVGEGGGHNSRLNFAYGPSHRLGCGRRPMPYMRL